MPLDNKVVPVDWLRTQLCYDPDTGIITNCETRNARNAKPGAEPCYPIARGYLAVKIYYKGDRYTFLAHKLAFALMTGHHPKDGVAHLDGRGDHNAWSNLVEREQTEGDGAAPVVARDLPRGVSVVARCRARPYRAQLGRRHIGNFATVEEAQAAYETAAAPNNPGRAA